MYILETKDKENIVDFLYQHEEDKEEHILELLDRYYRANLDQQKELDSLRGKVGMLEEENVRLRKQAQSFSGFIKGALARTFPGLRDAVIRHRESKK